MPSKVLRFDILLHLVSNHVGVSFNTILPENAD